MRTFNQTPPNFLQVLAKIYIRPPLFKKGGRFFKKGRVFLKFCGRFLKKFALAFKACASAIKFSYLLSHTASSKSKRRAMFRCADNFF